MEGFFTLYLRFRGASYLQEFWERPKVFEKVKGMKKWCFWKTYLEVKFNEGISKLTDFFL